MKRQICSYDMVAVPSSSYTVTDGEGVAFKIIWRSVSELFGVVYAK
jgi:hypothetical protein